MLARHVPSTQIFIWSEALLALIIVTTPLLASIPSLLQLPALLLWNGLGKGLTSSGFTASFLIINNSCRTDQRGRVNGLGMSLSSGFKAVGPMLGAVCYAWSLTNGSVLPFLDVHFAFFVCGLLCAATFVVAWLSFTPVNDRALSEQQASMETVSPVPPAGLPAERVVELSAQHETRPACSAKAVESER